MFYIDETGVSLFEALTKTAKNRRFSFTAGKVFRCNSIITPDLFALYVFRVLYTIVCKLTYL